MNIPYNLKFSRLKIFVDFAGQGMDVKFFSREKFNYKFITDARLDHENFIHGNLFLSKIWQNREIFNPRKILGYTVFERTWAGLAI